MTDRPASTAPPDPDRRRTFIAVVLVEIVVIVSLWAFSAHFGG